MSKNITISDAELPIMKVLWEKGERTSVQIFENMQGNKSTLKTLLQRLVNKGAVQARPTDGRHYIYNALLSKEEYVNRESNGFLKKVFDGCAQNMLLNFVKTEDVTKEDLQALLDMIEEQ